MQLRRASTLLQKWLQLGHKGSAQISSVTAETKSWAKWSKHFLLRVYLPCSIQKPIYALQSFQGQSYKDT